MYWLMILLLWKEWFSRLHCHLCNTLLLSSAFNNYDIFSIMVHVISFPLKPPATNTACCFFLSVITIDAPHQDTVVNPIDFHSCVSGKDWCTSEVITKVNDLHHNHPKWLPWWQMELHDCEEHLWWTQQYGWMLLVGQYYQRVGWTRILTNKAWWWLGAIPTNKAVAVDNEHRSIGHNWGSVGQLDYRKLSGWSYNSTQLVN